MSSRDSGTITNRFYVENWVYKGGVKKIVSAVYLPYIYREVNSGRMFTSIYIGEVNSGQDFFLTLTLYIPNFTLISDLVSDLGVTSGLFGEV